MDQNLFGFKGSSKIVIIYFWGTSKACCILGLYQHQKREGEWGMD